MTRWPEKPPNPNRAALVCHRPGDAVITFWDDAETATQASTELAPCDRKCAGVHSVVELVDGRYVTTTMNGAAR